MNFEIKTPTPRNHVLNCRVTAANKSYIQRLATRHKMSESYIVDQLIDKCREADGAGNKRKPARSN